MKRILSLLVVFAMVIAMIPSVFAAKTEIDMDELLGTLVYLDSIDMIDVALAEGAAAKTYKWTPESAGILDLGIYAELPEGMSATMTQGDKSVTFNADEAFVLEVEANVEVVIKVTKTAGEAIEFTMYGSFMPPLGTEGNPIFLYDLENEVTAAGTVEGNATWYQGYFSGTTMTVTGTGAFNVLYNGETLAAVDGVVSTEVSAPNPRMPVVFGIDTKGDYEITFEYPLGDQMNPAELVIGENTATVKEGSQGYYYSWIAEKNGKLTITMPEGNWFYVVNNMTSYVYGDWQYSNAEPAVPSTTIDVKAGDEIEVQVNTFDPESPWPAPAGSLTFTAAFEEATYIVGDLDGNEVVDIDDAVYLALHTMMPATYKVDQPVDFDTNGQVNIDDAVYLVLHTMMPGTYPLER